EQRLVLVLSVQLDEPAREVLQRAGRSKSAVDERAAPALRGDLASDDQLFAAALEDGFYRRAVFAGANQVARRPAAQQQADGLDEDRFAGAGFAREDVQPRLELDLGGVNDGQVADAQEAEHGESARTPIVT